MSLLQEAHHPANISRRSLLTGALRLGTGTVTLAFVGCGNSQNSQDSQAPQTSQKLPEVIKSKSPEEVLNSLLTTQVLDTELPSGMFSKGNTVATLDITAQQFKAIGGAQILIADTAYRAAPNSAIGVIGYTFFPNKTAAQQAFDTYTAQPSKKIVDQNGYKAVVFSQNGQMSLYTLGMGATVIDNIIVVGMYANDEAKAVSLLNSGVNHLKKVR